VGYVFNFVNASNMVRSALDNALLYAAANFRVDDILTRDVAGFRGAVRKRTIELAEKQNLGIQVEDCLVDSRPPRQLQTAFRSVTEAEARRGKALNEARSYENQVTTGAGADARALTNAAASDRALLVNNLAGEAERFNQVLPRYRENPGLFVQQRVTETLGRVMTNAQYKVLFSDAPGGRERELRLLLNRETAKSKPE
jgi:membrane protease subunit HflK